MRSQFEEKLDVDPSTGDVDAKGSFTWGPGEEKAVVAVSIFQEMGNGSLAKSGAGKAIFLKESNPSNWDLTVDSDPPPNQLSSAEDANPALAMGVVCALGQSIEMRQFIWCEEVTLK